MDDVKITIQGSTKEYNHVDTEIEAANIIIDDLGLDKSLFKYVKPCDDYSTIRYDDEEVDLFRIKYTDRSKWIQVLMTTEMRNKYKDNPLFEVEKNKNKVFWKSNIKDLHDYKDIILEGISFKNEYKKKN